MGASVVDSYPMPEGSAVPRSAHPWAIDPTRAALLVHDMQNPFVQAFPAGCSPVVELVENIATLRELAGTLGMPVIFSTETGAASIVPRLAPRVGEHLLLNVRHNAFLRSHLGRLLREAGRDQLILCGVRAHLGILLTAADAFMHDIQPFIVADAVADFCAEDHAMALKWVARTGVVCATDQLLRELLHGQAAAQGF
ncbi:isochorismatase family protein [Streptomyces geranii]|uniref:isochorismatase family protein n=1 Tax=Streptomyces geranii TaxID=2058923 RepID=UPI001E3AA97A|nr:isochorismatase family protein [Streptomyces geranii]